jgi:hypothetical protein
MGAVSPTPAASTPGGPPAGGGSKRPTRSRGIEVPDLVGRPAAGSVAELRKLGLKPNSVPEPVTDPLQAGMVIAQDPPAGEFVPTSTRVRIEIGDHSLFDPRKYVAAPEPPLVVGETMIPPIPTPLELLAYGEPQRSVAREQPTGEHGFETRWGHLDGGYDLGTVEDPYEGEKFPDFDPETGEITESVTYIGDSPDPLQVYEYKPRWTRKQRGRVLLSFCLLSLLLCLAATHLDAHHHTVKHHRRGAAAPAAQLRVVTVTVPSPTAPTTPSHRS